MSSTIGTVAQAFAQRETSFLPDLATRLSRLRVTPAGTLDIPAVGEVTMTEWSGAQFARLLGFQERYFERATPGERSDDLNRRLARSARSVRIRVARQADGNNVLRGFLGDRYTSIADSIVARAIADVLGPDLPVLWSAVTDRSSSAVMKVGDTYCRGEAKKVGDIWGTLTVRNSDVGYACLWASLSLFRVVCANGMALPDGRPPRRKRA